MLAYVELRLSFRDMRVERGLWQKLGEQWERLIKRENAGVNVIKETASIHKAVIVRPNCAS